MERGRTFSGCSRPAVLLVTVGLIASACGNGGDGSLSLTTFTFPPGGEENGEFGDSPLDALNEFGGDGATTTTRPPSTTLAIPTTTTIAVPADPVLERRPCRSADELADVTPVGFTVPGPWPRPEASPNELAKVTTPEQILSLTFDAEQSSRPVRALLEVLAEHGILTTFFVLAPWAEDNPSLVREIRDAGHEIANHTYAHERMAEWPADDIVADLNRAEDVLTGLDVASTKPWMRPGFGNRSESSVATAFEAGWTTVRWSNGANDSVGGSASEVQESICADLLEGAEAGAILISHTFNPQTPDAVDRFIREMHDFGYVFVPLSVLVADDPTEFIAPTRPG